MSKVKRQHSWRVQSDDRGRFDEIVVSGSEGEGGCILHAEMLNGCTCFVEVAGCALTVHVGKDGVARITTAEDRRTDAQKGRES